jgi:DNA-directed RNA polymerase specialized sigma24 family protein
VLTVRHIELDGSVSLPDLNPTAPLDLEHLVADVDEAVQWACLRYWGSIRQDELDDFSQPQDRDIYAAEQRRLLSRALGRLSEQEWFLYQLCFVFEQYALETATVFKIKVKNVYGKGSLSAPILIF